MGPRPPRWRRYRRGTSRADCSSALAGQVQRAHADAWQALGRLFDGRGGGTATYRGVRVMASGLPHPQWNSGDVTSENPDLDSARAFYARLEVEWGLRVPAGITLSSGRRLASQRLMGLTRPDFHLHPPPPGLELAYATIADLDDVLHVDALAYESDGERTRPWLAALLDAPDDVVSVVRGVRDGRTVATGYSVKTCASAGPSVLLAGIAVLPTHRRQGYGAAVSSWLVQEAFDAGAHLAHLQPDDDRAFRIYTRLGFIETPGIEIYVDL